MFGESLEGDLRGDGGVSVSVATDPGTVGDGLTEVGDGSREFGCPGVFEVSLNPGGDAEDGSLKIVKGVVDFVEDGHSAGGLFGGLPEGCNIANEVLFDHLVGV